MFFLYLNLDQPNTIYVPRSFCHNGINRDHNILFKIIFPSFFIHLEWEFIPTLDMEVCNNQK